MPRRISFFEYYRIMPIHAIVIEVFLLLRSHFAVQVPIAFSPIYLKLGDISANIMQFAFLQALVPPLFRSESGRLTREVLSIRARDIPGTR